ncbi:MAG: hypothetical protein JWP72_2715 [Massilia sp.]|nr:hypothetical protein [Massilia sp.]MDB5790786.1 hypothetical protein [Massilia sp.]
MILEANLKKSTLALSALTLALAAGLSACGGGSSSYTIGGIVTGLEHPGLVLSNNGEDLTVAPAGYETLPGSTVPTPKNVEYAFRNQAGYGDTYNVTVKASPAHQICGQNGGNTDTAGRLSVINAIISCVLVSNQISGTVTGLTSGELVLTNGSTGGTVTVPANATSFTLQQPVTYGQTFGITVLTKPAGLTCTVSNGAGIMGDDPVTTVAVACRPDA